MKNIAGERFGRLVAIRPTGRRHSRTVWECRCDCGQFTRTVVSYLLNGGTRSCGCIGHERNCRFIDLTGRQFGRLTVLELSAPCKNKTIWKCSCSCDGKTLLVTAGGLSSGHTKSCGCLAKQNRRTHGKRDWPEYGIWAAMQARCKNPNTASFANYGGRGIKVCDQWKGREGFDTFLRDMGRRPTSDHSLDRQNNDGNYEPGNCRWVTAEVQSGNRRNVKLLTWRRETVCMAEWARRLGISDRTISDLLLVGVPFVKLARLVSKHKPSSGSAGRIAR